jgi:ABC-type multidrug transport system fused ATPase/permease subunit
MSSPAPVIIVLMSVMLVLTAMERISTPLLAVSKAMVAACEFFAVIDAPLPASGDLKPDITSEDLIFDNVTFEYPSRPGVRILDGLNLRIRSGQNTALVGPSGSGKSTVVGLLERWYSLSNHQVLPQVIEAKKDKKDEEKDKPEESEKQESPLNPTMGGKVTVGGHNLEELNLKWWRAQIGLVQQEPFLFNDTIFKNVANGLVGTEFEDAPEEKKRELVKEACQEAYAEEFINRLPDVSFASHIFAII